MKQKTSSLRSTCYNIKYNIPATHEEQVCDSWWTSWTDMRNKCATHDEQVWTPEEYNMFFVRNLEASFWRWYSVEALRPPLGDDTRPYLPENTRPPMTHNPWPKINKIWGNTLPNFSNEKEYLPSILVFIICNLWSSYWHPRIQTHETFSRLEATIFIILSSHHGTTDNN